MDPVGVNVIETAALGRPFQLGMLYDCRKASLVPGLRIWTKDQMDQNICAHSQINTVFTVTASDSLKEKSKVLNIDGGLKLSVFCGLVDVGGSARFLKDTKTSFNQQRLTLYYHSSTKFEELTINHLSSGDVLHYDDDVATHVVTAMLYGADACFVFDRQVSSDEDKKTVAGEVKVALKKLICISAGAKLDLNEHHKTALQNFSCTFYGDFQLPSNPTTFEEAMKVFEDLPNLLGANNERVVPLRVWLYPLDKLFSRLVKFQHDISISLITDIESVIESLNTTEMKCSDLLTDSPALTFLQFHDKIYNIKQNCYKYKLNIMKELRSLLPKIRGKFIEDTTLLDLLREHEESPFQRNALEQKLKEKEEESDVMKILLSKLNESGATTEDNINKIMIDLEGENLVSYTFTSLSCSDELLSKQKAYLRPETKRRNDVNTRDSKHMTLLTPDIQKIMKNNLKIFKNLIDSKDRESAKFIVLSKEMEEHPGSCILLFEDGCDDAVCFSPPSKPDCPITEEIRGDQVVLKVSPSCPATVEMKLLYKMKNEKDWTSQPVLKNQRTVTLTDLRSDTEYDIKCAAVGKLNYTIESDEIHLKVIDKNLIRTIENVAENLSLTENRCSELLKNAKSKSFSALHQKIQDMRRYCQTYREDFNEQMKSLIKSVEACEKESCILIDLLQAHEESPFKEDNLIDWITVKEKEMNTVDVFLQQLLDSGAQVKESLDSYLSDIDVENLFCFTFTSLEQTDVKLSELENHMKPQMMRNLEKTSYVSSQSWITRNIREKMREHLKTFIALMKTNENKSTKFIISSEDHDKHPGSCILLFEDGCDEAVCFCPPSKPDCPITKEIRGDQVVLKVSPSCPATVEMKLMYKIKKEKDWTTQPVLKNQRTVTLTDLRSDTEYDIKCAAVGKLNYSIESDVMTVITQERIKIDELMKKSLLIEEGNPARYCLKTTDYLDETESYRKICFGERNPDNAHKIILMVGETGTGKTTLINTMINYMCGVQREDKIWFEITDDQSDRTSAHSQTSIITVYGVYIPESSLDLTIIDTPGYGNTQGTECDKEIASSLLNLITSEYMLHEINAVCFVIKADQTRLTDRQKYIFDAVQSLLGEDIEENIVLLFTHSNGLPPKNALTAVKEAKVKCAVDEKNQPIYFLFNNCQSETIDKTYKIIQEQSWDISFTGIAGMFYFLDMMKPKTLKMIKHVLQKRQQIEENISNLNSDGQTMEQKQNELKQVQDDLEKHNENKNFEFTDEVRYKEWVYGDPSKQAICCMICKENCYITDRLVFLIPVRRISIAEERIMKNNLCTVCPMKCHYSRHVQENKIFKVITKTEKRIDKYLKKQYENKTENSLSLVNKLKEELQELEDKKIKLVTDLFHCVESLEKIAPNTCSLFIIQHIDFLIEKMQEIKDPEKAEYLENIKKKAEEKFAQNDHVTNL